MDTDIAPKQTWDELQKVPHNLKYLFTSEIPNAAEEDMDDAPESVPNPVMDGSDSDSDKPHNADTKNKTTKTKTTKTKTTKTTNGTWYLKVLIAL